jgi:hypothetical protein
MLSLLCRETVKFVLYVQHTNQLVSLYDNEDRTDLRVRVILAHGFEKSFERRLK